MKTRAFTLIELLVVVLIIGILAAIAVPQYQLAVDKAQYSTFMNMVKSVKTAQHVFYLSNGRYAEDCEELGMETPSGLTLRNGKFYYDSLSGSTSITCYYLGQRVAMGTDYFGDAVSYERYLDSDKTIYYTSAKSDSRSYRLIKHFCGEDLNIESYGSNCYK